MEVAQTQMQSSLPYGVLLRFITFLGIDSIRLFGDSLTTVQLGKKDCGSSSY